MQVSKDQVYEKDVFTVFDEGIIAYHREIEVAQKQSVCIYYIRSKDLRLFCLNQLRH